MVIYQSRVFGQTHHVFVCSSISCTLLSPYLCLISFLYLDVYVSGLGIDIKYQSFMQTQFLDALNDIRMYRAIMITIASETTVVLYVYTVSLYLRTIIAK